MRLSPQYSWHHCHCENVRNVKRKSLLVNRSYESLQPYVPLHMVKPVSLVGIGEEQTESELTRQNLRHPDSAHAVAGSIKSR